MYTRNLEDLIGTEHEVVLRGFTDKSINRPTPKAKSYGHHVFIQGDCNEPGYREFYENVLNLRNGGRIFYELPREERTFRIRFINIRTDKNKEPILIAYFIPDGRFG